MKETTMKNAIVDITFDSGETRSLRAGSNSRTTAMSMALNRLTKEEQEMVKKVEFIYISN